MATVSEKDGIFWSLVAWGSGIVAFLVVYFIVRGIFGGSVPDGLVFSGVAFILVAGILTARIGPRDPLPVAQRHPAPAAPAQPVEAARPVSTAATPAAAREPEVAPRPVEAAPVAPATLVAPPPVEVAPVEVAAVEVAPVEVSAGEPAEGHSERVSEAAREAARLAADLDAPVTTPQRPARLEAARNGMPDDLKRIRGVGPKLEELLHRLGYYHFDQIAAWTPAEIAWVDTNIEDFPGRATRDDWVGQARILEAEGGGETSLRGDRGEIG